MEILSDMRPARRRIKRRPASAHARLSISAVQKVQPVLKKGKRHRAFSQAVHGAHRASA
jgi:hypothetical protein